MFWRVHQGEEQASPIEKILDRGDFTLEELLLEEDVIQEVKAMNDRLIDYLRKPETVGGMLKYVVEPFKAVVKLERELQAKRLRDLKEEEDKAAEEADDGEGAGDVSESLNADLDKLSLGGKEEGAPGDKSSTEEEDQGAEAAEAAPQEEPKVAPLSPEELQHYALQSVQRVCEILCCEVDEIFTALVSPEEEGFGQGADKENQEISAASTDGNTAATTSGLGFMGYLFSFLDQEKPLDSVLCGYYSRVIVSIAQRRLTEVSDYIQGNPDVLTKLVSHLYSYSITEFVLKLISGDEQNALYQKEQGNEWLVNTTLLDQLVERIVSGGAPIGKGEGEEGAEEQRLDTSMVTNAVSCVSGIANTAPSLIASQLQEMTSVTKLLGHLSATASEDALVAVVDVFISMLQPKQAKQSLSPDVIISYGAFSPVQVEETVDSGMVDCANLIMERVGDLCAMLKTPKNAQNDGGFDTSYGRVRTRLGMKRWKILDLIAKVVNIVDAAKCVTIVETTPLVSTCFALMVEMPFNSMLHNAVQTIIFGLLATENREVMWALIEKSRIHHLVSAVPAEIDSASMELSKKDKPLRAGYFGVVTSIANQILSFAATDTEIEKRLENDLQWTTWVVDVLVEQNKVEDPTSWECGRPSRVNDILGDMGGSSAVDLSLYSGLSVGVSSADNDRYDDNNDDFDMDGLDDDDDDDDEDVYEMSAADVVTSFQALGGAVEVADGGYKAGDSGMAAHGADFLDQETIEEDNVVLISSLDDQDQAARGSAASEAGGVAVDLKLIQEKQQLKRADTPYGAVPGASAGSIDPQFNTANFWRSAYMSYDISEDEK